MARSRRGTEEAGARSGWHLLWITTLRTRAAIIAGVVAGLLWTGARVVIPSLTGAAVDKGVIHHSNRSLATYAILIIVLGVGSATCSGFRRFLAFKVAYAVETDLREGMFANLQRLDFRFHDNAQTGQLMARAATDLQQINGFITMIPITIANFLTLTVVSVLLLSVDWRLGLLALACLPFVNLAAKRFSTLLHPVSLSLQQDLSVLSTIVEESVTGIRAVKGFGAEAAQLDRMRGQTDTVFSRIMRLAIIRGNFTPLLDVLPAVSLAVVLWYGGLQVLHGDLSIGQLVAFNVYVVMLVGPLRMLGQTIASAQRAVASAERVAEILDASPSVTEPDKPVPLPAGGGLVRFSDVRFAYGETTRPVLDGFNLAIAPGESVALVGSTGSGKTSVARLIPRFYDVAAGSVSIDGVDVRRLPLRDLRRAVAVVFEDTFLFTGSVGDNIAFGEPDAPIDKVLEAARLAGADEFVAALPDGYDTLLGERGFSLSGGQRQRIALARAILANPRVLILDDATSSVDASKEHEIRDALATVMAGRTTIVISHRPATIALASRVVLLDDGRIVAEGTHESLLATSERYQEVLAQGAAIDAARAELSNEGARV
ncbi:MAG TPA: ABC transporter ATP-binding protein [Acidimicrobiales bacterium]|nr:ABC transporter ATP-binding protein [Acidimicrobiales bacterium]